MLHRLKYPFIRPEPPVYTTKELTRWHDYRKHKVHPGDHSPRGVFYFVPWRSVLPYLLHRLFGIGKPYA